MAFWVANRSGKTKHGQEDAFARPSGAGRVIVTDQGEAYRLTRAFFHGARNLKLSSEIEVRPGHAALTLMTEARFALICPDQHVAWCGDDLPDPSPLLERVTGYA